MVQQRPNIRMCHTPKPWHGSAKWQLEHAGKEIWQGQVTWKEQKNQNSALSAV